MKVVHFTRYRKNLRFSIRDLNENPPIPANNEEAYNSKIKNGNLNSIDKLDPKTPFGSWEIALPLAVGPIFDETGAILKIVEKLGSYQKCMPWSFIQQFSLGNC